MHDEMIWMRILGNLINPFLNILVSVKRDLNLSEEDDLRWADDESIITSSLLNTMQKKN